MPSARRQAPKLRSAASPGSNGNACARVGRAGPSQIIPDLTVRQEAIPTITSKDTRVPSEYVTQIIPVKNVSASMLVPILRPLLPQQGHLAATAGNSLLISDHFDNVRRIEALVRALDTAENKPRDAAPPREEH
jgi:type II secretory pathway component GspD/PulD (secretin)